MDKHPYISCLDCWVWDPENQPSVLAKLEADPTYYDDKAIMLVPNGEVLYGHPLYTDLLLCTKHETEENEKMD